MLTHVSCYDEIWTWVSEEQRAEVQAWLLAHEQLPMNTHTITLEIEGEQATAFVEGYVRDEQGNTVIERADPDCHGVHGPECVCTVQTNVHIVQCKTLPPFTRWPHMGSEA